ncbi:HYR domain-containing protein [Gillisia sp. M10.2A]|uniref:HYR domain-containing protein n=1 Tax=Gillisia lutea TaxID=2909668 RepID=A0ABS9ED19_9FLAO|nr:HYR domain-containing protein [Gillisia lutea]MCF4100074.1 HYR domain-containing protein [Gillisia lutea]
MKNFTLYFIFLMFSLVVGAQTTLGPGDIAFIGTNSDGATYEDDTVAFVLLKDIDAATSIIFTDRGWNDDTGFLEFPGDSQFTWTSGVDRKVGEVVELNLTPLYPAAYSTIGDQMFAIQGSIELPVFIAGIHTNVNSSSTDGNWDGAAENNSTSALPNDLTNGVNAMRFTTEFDNGQFSANKAGGNNYGSPQELRLAVNNIDNWNFSNDTSYNPAIEPGIAFDVECVPSNTPNLTLTNNNICPGSSTTINISGNLNAATEWVIYSNSCGGTLVGRTSTTSFEVTPPNGDTTYYIRGEDGAGCLDESTATCANIVVTAGDTTPPTITCPENIEVNTDEGVCGAVVTYNVLVTDNCEIPQPEKTGFTALGIYNNKYYYRSNALFTAEAAFTDAQSNGGNVVTINDAAENNFINSTLTEGSVIIGLTDREVEGVYVWENRENFTYRNWAPNEPNNSGDEDYAELIAGGLWNDIPNSTEKPYILEVNSGIVQTAGLASGSEFPVGTTTNTFEVTDASGNKSACSFNITVNDTGAPTAIAQNITVELDENGEASITAAQINNGSSDVCGDVTLSLDKTTFSCSDIEGSNTALDFDGVDDYVNIASPYYQFTNEITVSWWVKFDGNSAFMAQSTENVDDMNTNVWLMHSARGNGIGWYVNDNGTWRSIDANTTPGWHLITGVSNASATKLYIDGIEVGSASGITSGILNNSNSVIHIGKDSRYPVSSGRVNKFTVDDVIIYNRALTQSEIENLKTTPPNLNDSNLKGYWNFNEANGDIVNDLSTVKAQGSLVNMDSSTDWITSGTTITAVTSVILTVADEAGNRSTATAYVTIEDNTAPTIICPENIEVDNDSGVNGAVITYNIPVSDNCKIPQPEKTDFTALGAYNGKFYYLSNNNFLPADAFAHAEQNDGNIVTINNAAENGVVNTLLNGTSAMIGFTDEVTEGEFVWKNGEAVTYTNWGLGEPNNSGPEDYTQIYSAEGLWNDYKITTAIQYVLEVNMAVQTAGLLSGSEFPIGTTTNTFEVTDASGNKSTCSFDVIVKDVEAPAGYTVSIDRAEIDETNETSISFTFADAEVGTTYNYTFSSDNGVTDVTGTGTISTMTDQITGIDLSGLEDGTITLSVTLTDEATNEGNAATDTVIKNTNEAPEAVCKAFTAYLNTSGNVTIAVEDVDGGSTDDKEGFTLSLGNDSFDCSNIGENVVELTITDSDNVKSSCFATVTVVDNIAPIIANIEDIEVDTDAGICGAVVNYDITATDNCGNSTSGKVLIIWDVLNEHTINLKDALTNAGLDVTMSETSETAYDGTNPALQNFDAVIHLNGTTYSQGMPIEGQNALVDFVLNQGNTYITEEWSAYEVDSQNTMTTMSEIVILKRTGGDSQSYTYEIIPTESGHPILKDIPNTITLPNGGSNVGGLRAYANNPAVALMNFTGGVGVAVREFEGGGAAVGFAHAGNYANSTILSDSNVQKLFINATKFNNNSIKITQTSGLASGSVFPVGTTTNTFEATDASGNKTTYSFDVTVTDNESPEALTKNITVELDDTGNVAITAANVDNESSDACGIASMSVSPDSFTCSEVGENTVTLTVIDNNGNESTTTSTVTVEDNVAAVAVAKNIRVQLDDTGNAAITAANVDNESSDACGIASMSVSPDSFTCSEVGENTVTLTVIDNNGNESTTTSTVTVEDNVAAVAVAKNITVQLDETGNVSIIAADVDNGSEDACGIASMSVSPDSFSCAEVGENTVTLTVVDVNGNESSNTAIVTVLDNIAPTAIAQKMTIYLNENGEASTTAEAVNNGSFDNCGIESLSLSKTDFDCSNVGDNTVVLTVTDVNGNKSEAEANVVVLDNIAPTAIAQEVTIYLDENGEASTTAEAVNNASLDNCTIASLSLSKTEFDCSNVGDNTVVLTVTDVNENVATVEANVIVLDNIAPTAIAQEVTIYLDENGEASTTAEAVNNASFDNCTIASLSLSKTDFDCSNVGDNTVVLTVTDVNGNKSEAEANVIVLDNIAPTAIAQEVTIYLNENGEASTTAEAVNNASFDNCGVESLSLSKTDFDCSNVGDNTVVLTVTDVNENVATVEANVIVLDNIAPTAIAQEVTIYLDENGQASTTAEAVNNASFDNCTIASVSLSKTDFDCSNIGSNTVVLTVTDVNGNKSEAEANVIVKDTLGPVPSNAILSNIFAECEVLEADVTIPTATDNCSGTIEATHNVDFPITAQGTSLITWTYTDANGNITTQTQNVIIRDTTEPVPDVAELADLVVECSIANIAAPTATDNCGGTITGTTLDPLNYEEAGEYLIMWEYNDNNGNIVGQEQWVVVKDVTAPTVSAQDITIFLTQDSSVTITPEDIDNGTTDNCSEVELSLDRNSFDELGTYEVTLTATDATGNSASATVSVTVKRDGPNPVEAHVVPTMLKGTSIAKVILPFKSRVMEVQVLEVETNNYKVFPGTKSNEMEINIAPLKGTLLVKIIDENGKVHLKKLIAL